MIDFQPAWDNKELTGLQASFPQNPSYPQSHYHPLQALGVFLLNYRPVPSPVINCLSSIMTIREHTQRTPPTVSCLLWNGKPFSFVTNVQQHEKTCQDIHHLHTHIHQVRHLEQFSNVDLSVWFLCLLERVNINCGKGMVLHSSILYPSTRWQCYPIQFTSTTTACTNCFTKHSAAHVLTWMNVS